MARVTITREWPDGDIVRVQVTADDGYADALDEARTIARRAFVDALAACVGEWDDMSDDEVQEVIAQLEEDE